MKKILLPLMLSLFLVSCGLGARLDGIELSGTPGFASSDSGKGSQVGSVTLAGNCSVKEYSLENDFNGYFEVNGQGQILLAKDNPPAGTYNLVVVGKCGDQEERVAVRVEITDPVVVAPVISTDPWVLQLGGNTLSFPGADNTNHDVCTDSTVDIYGNIYCAGFTFGSVGEANGGQADAFVMKVSPEGDVQWVRQLGANTLGFSSGDNSQADECHGVAVDSSGNVFCAGYTSGSLGEVNSGSTDAFVMKLSPSGEVLWVRQLGASTHGFSGGDNSGSERCNGIDVDSSGNAYIACRTTGSVGEANGGQTDAFVMKIDPNGNLSWVTQLGSNTLGYSGGDNSRDELPHSIAVNELGDVIVGAQTTGGVGEPNAGSTDALAIKLNTNGNIEWARQLGVNTLGFAGGDNSLSESFKGITFDSQNNVIAVGATFGSIGEVNSLVGGINGGSNDSFVVKFNSSGSMLWASQLGVNTLGFAGGDNSQGDSCNDVATDSHGNIYCAGGTFGNTGETNAGSSDIFIAKFSPSGSFLESVQLGQSTKAFIGGSNAGYDSCYSINIDSSDNIYCSGDTRGSLVEPHSGGADIFVLKFNPSLNLN